MRISTVALALGSGGAALLAVAAGNTWTADLRPPTNLGFVSGKATMGPVASRRDSIQISLQLVGADTSSAHPWVVRKNLCDTKTGGNLAPMSAFPPISVSSSSSDPNAPTTGSGSVVLPGRAPTRGKYSVQVYASTKDTAIVIACGDFMNDEMMKAKGMKKKK